MCYMWIYSGMKYMHRIQNTLVTLGFLTFFSGCNFISDEEFAYRQGANSDCSEPWFLDADGDGVGGTVSLFACDSPGKEYTQMTGDCDDENPRISPISIEDCSTDQDEDCDGTLNAKDPSELIASSCLDWFADRDGDGFGDDSDIRCDCVADDVYTVLEGGDCYDQLTIVNPDQEEICGDGFDNDCDGAIDDADGNVVTANVWYLDHDADGYGDPLFTLSACNQPANYVADNTDCDDFNFASSPAAQEVCDGLDNNCDGLTDDLDPAVAYANSDLYYQDTDGDGFGDAATSAYTCEPTASMVSTVGDCDDTDATVSPNAAEICDGIDNNCDSTIDGSDAVNQTTWYFDSDSDGHGDSAVSLEQCDQPQSYVLSDADCDDDDATISPNAAEICDGIDNNCDSSIDGSDAVNQTTWYLDDDADGHGDPTASLEQCDQPTDYVDVSTDCDDTDVAINPDEFDTCDGIDNDCDGEIDEDAAIGSSSGCAATSCADILADDPTAQDGVYYIEDASGNPIEAYCEMDFDGGGWLVVYNFIHPGDSTSDVATMHSSLTQNANMTSAIDPTMMSTSISTLNIPLADYQEVVYGWAPSSSQDVAEYGMYTDSNGLTGNCYLDGYCGANVAVGDFYISTTGSTRTIYTGNSPGYPHVGLGFSGQIIVWGYDLNASSYGHWANWYDGNSCCASGNTSAITTGGWRYVIYIR